MEMLTGEPNYVRHYNHIGFPSYFVIRECWRQWINCALIVFRVGHVKENIEEMEPVIRNSQYSALIFLRWLMPMPANTYRLAPNDLMVKRSCVLMRYAGMSPNVNTIGIYGYDPIKTSMILLLNK
jgi:hypothetical protein